MRTTQTTARRIQGKATDDFRRHLVR
jgi:hypothetical protein